MAYRSSSNVWSFQLDGGGSGTGITLTKPLGTVSGDLLLAVFNVDGPGEPVSGLSSWTQAAQHNVTFDGETFTVYYKQAGGSEPSTYVIDCGQGYGLASMLCFSGYTGGAPVVGTFGSDSVGTSSPIALTAPGITTLALSDIILMGGLDQNSPSVITAGVPSGYTLRQFATNTDDYSSFVVSSKDEAAAGATGSQANTLTSSGMTAGWQGLLMAFPTTAGTPPPAIVPTRFNATAAPFRRFNRASR